MAVQLGVHGAAGRMGQRVVALAASDRRFKVVAALESARLGFSRIGPVAHVSWRSISLPSKAPVPVLLRRSKIDVNVT